MVSYVPGLIVLAKEKIVQMLLISIIQPVNARNGYRIVLSIIQSVWIKVLFNVIVWTHLLLTLNVMGGIPIAQ